MNDLKYRLILKVGTIEISSPCTNEIDLLRQLASIEYDSFKIMQYMPCKSGARELDLKKISKVQFMKNLMTITFKKGS